MNVLLVEPPYRTKRLPLALQKIATYRLKKNDNVAFFKGDMPIFNKDFGIFKVPDIIYISSMFTYKGRQTIKTIKHYKKLFPDSEIKVGGVFPTLMPEFLEKETGIKPHIGLWDEIDHQLANFSLFKADGYKYKNGIVFTSRGCVRKCAFCAVRKIEPNFFISKNWKEQIKNAVENGCEKILIQDNNFTATSWTHQVAVINYIKNNFPKITIDFNGGFDCRLFKEKHAKLYSKIKIHPVRFSFDGMHEEGYCQRAIELCKKYNVSKKITICVLYNFKDTPQYLWHRIREVLILGADVFLMKYAPVDSLNKKYIGENWTEKSLKNFYFKTKKLATNVGQIIPASNKNALNEIGETVDDFISMLNDNPINSSPENWNKKQKMKSAKLKNFEL